MRLRVFIALQEQLGKIHFKKFVSMFAFGNLYLKILIILRFLRFNIINYVLNCIKFAKNPTNPIPDTPVDQISNRISLRLCPHFLICRYISSCEQKAWTGTEKTGFLKMSKLINIYFTYIFLHSTN